MAWLQSQCKEVKCPGAETCVSRTKKNAGLGRFPIDITCAVKIASGAECGATFHFQEKWENYHPVLSHMYSAHKLSYDLYKANYKQPAAEDQTRIPEQHPLISLSPLVKELVGCAVPYALWDGPCMQRIQSTVYPRIDSSKSMSKMVRDIGHRMKEAIVRKCTKQYVTVAVDIGTTQHTSYLNTIVLLNGEAYVFACTPVEEKTATALSTFIEASVDTLTAAGAHGPWCCDSFGGQRGAFIQ